MDKPEVSERIDDLIMRFKDCILHEDKSVGWTDRRCVTKLQFKQAIQKLLTEARISELVGVLKQCPMPTLSYEDVENRIKELEEKL